MESFGSMNFLGSDAIFSRNEVSFVSDFTFKSSHSLTNLASEQTCECLRLPDIGPNSRAHTTCINNGEEQKFNRDGRGFHSCCEKHNYYSQDDVRNFDSGDLKNATRDVQCIHCEAGHFSSEVWTYTGSGLADGVGFCRGFCARTCRNYIVYF